LKVFAVVLLSLSGVSAFAAVEGLSYTVSSEARLRVENRDNRDFSDASDDKRSDILARFRVGLAAKHAGTGLSALIQAQATGDHIYLPGDDKSGDSTGIRQFYVEWTPLTVKQLTLRAGRQDLSFGLERLVGVSNWTNMSRSWDGFRANYAKKDWKVSSFGGQLGLAAPVATRPSLYGVYATRKRDAAGLLDVYALYKHDEPAAGNLDVYTVGSRVNRTFGDGWDCNVETAGQFGRRAGRDIEAWAVNANAGYTFANAGAWKPRAFVELNAASGGDPASDKHKTFDTIYGTSHAKYGNMDYVSWSNILDFHVGAGAHAAPTVVLQSDLHWFRLQNAKDAWYGPGAAPNKGVGGKALHDPTGASGRNVGFEADLQATWTVNKDMTVSGGYSRFFPGSFIERTNGVADGSDWLFVQAAWKR
jgi:hypothetical protein